MNLGAQGPSSLLCGLSLWGDVPHIRGANSNLNGADLGYSSCSEVSLGKVIL